MRCNWHRYEPELIRSSIPNFFLAKLAAQHTKVVLTGEGADELFAGYLYFKDCPSRELMQSETLRIWGASSTAARGKSPTPPPPDAITTAQPQPHTARPSAAALGICGG